MEDTYIDIGHTKIHYERAISRFKQDAQISDRNKELVLKFLRDAALGKTVIGKAKKKINAARLYGILKQLYHLMLFCNKDLDQVTQDDMEAFIEALEGDRIRSRDGFKKRIGQPLSDRYKLDIKVSVRKFYKWLLGENKHWPSIVEWIDTYCEPGNVSALTEDEVEKMIDHCRSPMQRALIQVLFDGGFRLGELLNIRLHHVELKRFDPHDPSRKCFLVRVPFSKTFPRTVSLPIHATTKWLEMWLEDQAGRQVIRHDGTLDAPDMNLQLFPLTDNSARQIVNKIGRKALGKRVYPHLLRHTSATFWSNHLSYFRMCKRFGWSMTSSMPQRYIDRAGVDEIEIARSYHSDDRGRLQQEKDALLTQLTELKTRLSEEKGPRAGTMDETHLPSERATSFERVVDNRSRRRRARQSARFI